VESVHEPTLFSDWDFTGDHYNIMNRFLSSVCSVSRADPVMFPRLVNGILYGMHSEVVVGHTSPSCQASHLCVYVVAHVLDSQGLVERGSLAFDSSITPVVVLPPLHEADLTKEALQDLLDQAQQSDDVLTDEFRAQAVFLVPPNSSKSSYAHKISSLGLFKAVFRYGSGLVATTDMPAPYFIQGSNLHQAWRLYEDRVDAFVVPVVPEKVEQPSR